MATGKRREKILKERARRRASYEAAIVRAKNNPGSLVPSKYRMRAEARRSGKPMTSRSGESLPWYAPLKWPHMEQAGA